jgi:hypothetical protein
MLPRSLPRSIGWMRGLEHGTHQMGWAKRLSAANEDVNQLYQCHQQIESPAAEMNRHIVSHQHAFTSE